MHQDIFFHAIPNGGRRDPLEAKRLKDEGVRAGVPDIFIAEPRGPYHGLYVEMKRIKGSVTSKAQIECMGILEDKGYLCVVCKGFKEAKEVFHEYLNLSGTFLPEHPSRQWVTRRPKKEDHT